MTMLKSHASVLWILVAGATVRGQTPPTTPGVLPLRVDPIPKREIRDRLGLREAEAAEAEASPDHRGGGGGGGGVGLSIGTGPHMGYHLIDEHEVSCPTSGTRRGVFCTAILPRSIEANENEDDAASVAGDRDLVSQAILAGSLAASLRDRHRNGAYYLPRAIVLEESFAADGTTGSSADDADGVRDGILADLSDWELSSDDGSSSDDDGPSSSSEGRRGERVMMYACGGNARGTEDDDDRGSSSTARSDVYLWPGNKKGRIWRFSVEFKVATINLRQIASFGDRDSTTPLRPKASWKGDVFPEPL